MLKANIFTGQGLRCKVFSLSTSIPRTIVLKAFISTNTAIQRGIRKSNPGAKRSESRTKYREDRAGGFSSKSRTLSAKREYPKASDFGSKYSGDKKGRFSAKPHTFSTEQKYPEARNDFRPKYSRERNGRFSTEPRDFSTEPRHSEARRDSGSKYSGDKRGRFSSEPREFTPENKYPEARRDSKSKYSGDKKGRFSAKPPTFSTEQKYPEARNDFRPKYSKERNGRFSTEPRDFSTEPRYSEARRDSGAKYSGDKKGRFSSEPHEFTTERRNPEARTDSRSKHSGDGKGRFSAAPPPFNAEQSHSGASRSHSVFKYNRDKGGNSSAGLEWRTRSQEGSVKSGARESESSRTPRWLSGGFQNNRERSNTFQGEPPRGYSLPSSAGGSEPTGGSTRMAASTDTIDQSGGSQRPDQRRHQPALALPKSPIRFNGPRAIRYDADSRSPSSPDKVLGGMDVKTNPPLGIPYTTSASEFLFGTSVVTSALQFSRRKLYNVYVWTSESRVTNSQDAAVRTLALARRVNIINVTGGSWRELMDKMSDGRPHNGYILEASPLPMLPVTGLQRVHDHPRALKVHLGHQSREEEAINGTKEDIQFQPAFPRYPFVLLLAGVADLGNLGAIIRSAFLFGVDAIAISKRATAPLNPVVLKASAGAAESMPLLRVDEPVEFIRDARLNGWKIYVAMPSDRWESWKRESCTNHSLGRPVLDHPCVLMIGGEGQGLERSLQRLAEIAVNVEGARMGQGGVDSLNASVATAILCDAFLQKGFARPLSEEIASGGAGSDDPTLSDHTSPVDLNEEDPELQEATVDESVAEIDETKTHQDLDDESVSAPKDRLF